MFYNRPAIHIAMHQTSNECYSREENILYTNDKAKGQ